MEKQTIKTQDLLEAFDQGTDRVLHLYTRFGISPEMSVHVWTPLLKEQRMCPRLAGALVCIHNPNPPKPEEYNIN